MPKLLIVIPAYNEEGSIERVVDDLIQNYPQYDYVVVNDGSRDRTAAICRSRGYRLIDLPVNLGLAGAFQTAPCSWMPMASTCPGTSPPCWKSWRPGPTL